MIAYAVASSIENTKLTNAWRIAMTTKKTIAVVMLGMGFWFATKPCAEAQQVNRPFDARYRDPYAARTSPTVSPYVNLANENGGYTNYQSLVRPLIEEREELNRQWSALEALNHRVGGVSSRELDMERRRTKRGTSGARWMHYSHYFGTNR